MTTTRPLLPLLAIALFLGACTTAPREAARSAPAPAPARMQPESSKNLRKGMTELEIRAAWGEPKAVHAGKEEGETILVYHFDVLTTQKMIAATMSEVPSVDPITGEARTVMEPVLTPQKVTVVQTIVLQLKNGALVSWARQLGEERSFN